MRASAAVGDAFSPGLVQKHSFAPVGDDLCSGVRFSAFQKMFFLLMAGWGHTKKGSA